MATPDKKRKSTRNFNLEKRGGHSFDLEKEEVVQEVIPGAATPEEPKVDTPVDIPSATDTAPQEPTPPEETTLGNGKAWIWILLAVIAVVLIVWLMPKGCSGEKQDDGTAVGLPDSVEVVEVVESGSEEDSVNLSDVDGVEGNTPSAVSEETSSQAVQSTESTNSTETTSTSAQTAAPATTSASDKTSVATNTSNSGTSTSSAVVSGDVEEEALKVIRGVYGDGQERKNRLGAKYQEIQNRVNQLKRQGAF